MQEPMWSGLSWRFWAAGCQLSLGGGGVRMRDATDDVRCCMPRARRDEVRFVKRGIHKGRRRTIVTAPCRSALIELHNIPRDSPGSRIISPPCGSHQHHRRRHLPLPHPPPKQLELGARSTQAAGSRRLSDSSLSMWPSTRRAMPPCGLRC
jgi:hypothetical protein